MRKITLALCFLLIAGTLSAQFSGGFRAGLNFISLDGPSEMNAAGESLQTFNNTTGFHVGATFAFAFTDLFGVKADLMYSQKGGEIIYGDADGGSPSFLYLYANDADPGQQLTGNLRQEIDIVNSYIDIPMVAYYRIGGIELEAGVSAGFLVGSRASGGATYDLGRLGEYTINIDGSYLSDEAGINGIVSVAEPANAPPNSVNFPGIIAPYYNSDKDDNLFRRLDFGLVVGVSYFLNSGLYIGARYQHGLTDVTNGENDLRLTQEGGGSRVFNTEDEDFNRSFQASVGFRF